MMIYVDTSVALAHLLSEDRRPPDELWLDTLASSRLLEYEIWTRLNARGLAKSHGDSARELLARIALVELAPPVLVRALEPFSVPVRTLDAIHLASAHFLQSQNQHVELASYDDRMLEAAESLDLAIWPPCAKAPPPAPRTAAKRKRK